MDAPVKKLYQPCRGGICDKPEACHDAGGCLYRSSADEAREVMAKEKLQTASFRLAASKADTPPEWRKPQVHTVADCSEECYRLPNGLPLPKAVYTGQDANSLPDIQEAAMIRTFSTGANRDVDNGKLDYEGFLSPTVLKRFSEYMHKNRFLRDGSMRDSDNWQKGIPLNVYMKSMMRHFMSIWLDHRLGGYAQEEELCALMFNVMGYLHQRLKGVEE